MISMSPEKHEGVTRETLSLYGVCINELKVDTDQDNHVCPLSTIWEIFAPKIFGAWIVEPVQDNCKILHQHHHSLHHFTPAHRAHPPQIVFNHVESKYFHVSGAGQVGRVLQ